MRELESKFIIFMLIFLWASGVESKCRKGCDLALASYNIWNGTNFTFIADMFDTSIENIQSFNLHVPDKDKVQIGTRINVPFNCNCIHDEFLGHSFAYHIRTGDSYQKIGGTYYANLTTVEWLTNSNRYNPNNIPDVDTTVDVIVNCSCGDKKVSKEYGLFVTYPLSPGENLTSIANASGVPPELLQSYNPHSDFSSGSGLVFVPGKDQTGNFPRLKISTVGISRGVVAGISVGVAGALFLVCLCAGVYRRKKSAEVSFLPGATEEHGSKSTLQKTSETTALVASSGLTSITVDKSVEFSYEELAKATNDFSIANKIGQGGFGAVYYAELRGEKAAIKKMQMRASKEFYAELKILTNVHHLNLVRLLGYCAEGFLFLVYEFIENGNLSQHLQGSEKEPLPWSTRMQIALDSATGLEYIHEHTVPVYIHRDIKSANILVDKNFRAKVADFGLTKLTEFESELSHTEHPMGTFGYMPPEYLQFGEVSPKIDVYAFGVVLYEIISAKGAVVKRTEAVTESTGLVALFEDVLSQPDPREDLEKLVDPRLGDNYPLDSVLKMAELAKACTQEDPQLRPSMREIVVALTTFSSETREWNVSAFHENKALLNLMSGK